MLKINNLNAKIEDKSISEIKKETPKPTTRTEIDNNDIKIEAFTWLQPLSISLWCRCLLSGKNGELPDFALKT